jgi:hypothetical protein
MAPKSFMVPISAMHILGGVCRRSSLFFLLVLSDALLASLLLLLSYGLGAIFGQGASVYGSCSNNFHPHVVYFPSGLFTSLANIPAAS